MDAQEEEQQQQQPEPHENDNTLPPAMDAAVVDSPHSPSKEEMMRNVDNEQQINEHHHEATDAVEYDETGNEKENYKEGVVDEQHHHHGHHDTADVEGDAGPTHDESPNSKRAKNRGGSGSGTTHDPNESEIRDEDDVMRIQVEEAKVTDPVVLAQIELMEASTPSTELEIAYKAALQRKEVHLARLTTEIIKLKQFISKRKQTYKRKRKDDGAPTRALSAYNIFIQDRFAKLAKENENALMSEDLDATMKRVPPASLVAATGNAWKTLPAEEKEKYEER